MVSYFRPIDFELSVESIINNTDEYHLSIIDNSCGGLKKQLSKYSSHQHITIYENDTNIGKGRGVMKWYNQIMNNSTEKFFISIDSDIEVQPKWLPRLINARSKIKFPFGILAPTIMNTKGEWFNLQKQSKFIMHNTKVMYHISDELYYNRYTAGPVILIDREFFESINGYSQDQLYGSDDGKLCKAADDQGRFIGIISNVHVIHLRNDNSVEYQKWKNTNMGEDGIGYWDQFCNQNNIF